MNKSIVILICTAFCLSNALAQSNFKKGYIISNSNDTILGYIDFRTDLMNSKLCKFKTDINEQEQQFLPGEILAFRFIDDGKFYVSKHISINNIDYHVFLEFLVQGIKNLYFFPFENGYYFFENLDGTMVAITKQDDKIFEVYKIKQDLMYIGKLSYVFKDCLPIATKTNDAKFDRKSMIDLTMKYHVKMCDSGESCVLFANDYNKKYTKFSATPYIGLEYNSLKMDVENMPTMYSISPVVGGMFGFSSPRYYKPLWFEFDINVSKLSGAAEYLIYNPTDFVKYSFSSTKLSYNVGLKHVFPINKLQLYAKAGLGRSFLINVESTYTIDYYNKNYHNYYLPKNLFINSNVGIGVEKLINKENYITFELMYCISDKYIDILNTLQFKVGYKFE